jgi:hypothetical protein
MSEVFGLQRQQYAKAADVTKCVPGLSVGSPFWSKGKSVRTKP